MLVPRAKTFLRDSCGSIPALGPSEPIPTTTPTDRIGVPLIEKIAAIVMTNEPDTRWRYYPRMPRPRRSPVI
jgi:hypothetical protein